MKIPELIAILETCLPVSNRNDNPNLPEMFSLSSEKLEFAEGYLLQNSVPAPSQCQRESLRIPAGAG